MYKQCLSDAKDKGLKLCPRGYCTAKMKFEVYPSAYANGYAAQVCAGEKPDYMGKIENSYGSKPKDPNSDLTRWYNEEWVNVCEQNQKGEYLPCGRAEAKLDASDYPYCRPLHKLPGTPVISVGELTKGELSKMCKSKRSIQPGVDGAPTHVYINEVVGGGVSGSRSNPWTSFLKQHKGMGLSMTKLSMLYRSTKQNLKVNPNYI